MKGWKHPRLGRIDPLSTDAQPHKVWKHFYDEAEHWERLCDTDVASLRGESERIVGEHRERESALPRMSPKKFRRAKKLLKRHHDDFYARIYGSEMMSEETIWTPFMDSQHRVRALTLRSIFVVVELESPECRVVTAYRPHPTLRDVSMNEAEIQRYAKDYFERRTGMKLDGLARTAADCLQRATTAAPVAASDTWWLASAIGYGRLLSTHALVKPKLQVAERMLESVSPNLLTELAESLDWDGCLELVASALKETRPEDLEHALASSEELLAVAGPIEANDAAKEFIEAFELLIAWVPPEWSHLADTAGARTAAFNDSDSLVLRMWESVEEAVLASLIREGEPTVRPAATLIDSLIPPPKPWHRFADRISKLPTRIGASVSAAGYWAASSLDSIAVQRPAPAMGDSATDSEHWEVRSTAAENAPDFRAFVVDDDHPDGYDVSDLFSPTDVSIWQIDSAEDSALVVVVAGEAPLHEGGLDALLNEAEAREDVVVQTREVQPTQVTKAKR